MDVVCDNRIVLLPLIAFLLVCMHESRVVLAQSGCAANQYRDYEYNQISSGKCNSNTVVTSKKSAWLLQQSWK